MISTDIIFATAIGTVDDLLAHVDKNSVNVWVVAAPGVGKLASSLAAGFGFKMDEVSGSNLSSHQRD